MPTTDNQSSPVPGPSPRRRWLVRLLAALVVLLLIASGVQTFFTIRLLRRDRAETARDNHSQTLALNTAPPAVPATPPQSQKTIPLSPGKPGNSLTSPSLIDPFSTGNGDPFQEMEEMQKRMDQLMQNSFGASGFTDPFSGEGGISANSSDMQLQDKGDHYEIRVDIPGVKDGNFQVTVNGRTLTISGDQNESDTNRDSSGQVVRHEQRMGHFQQSIELPEPVDSTKMDTQTHDGVLTITIPKAK